MEKLFILLIFLNGCMFVKFPKYQCRSYYEGGGSPSYVGSPHQGFVNSWCKPVEQFYSERKWDIKQKEAK